MRASGDPRLTRSAGAPERAGARGGVARLRRVIVIVLDSCGVGELPDAVEFGDLGASTLPHTAAACGGLRMPTLGRLGLGRIVPVLGVSPDPAPAGAFGKMAEVSPGKDSTTGHWEMMGLILDRPFPTYPHGFPPEIIDPFEARIGRRVLGNRPASGTAIIQQLGEEHLRTGRPIVYTSADSVFQIAAHEDVLPVDELYRDCRIARELLTGPHAVGRVIARPFVGAPGRFVRTDRRRDFSLAPPGPTVLDRLHAAGEPVVAVGKVSDLFAGRGITDAVHTHDDRDGMAQTLRAMDTTPAGLIFANLVDLDTLFGHRNDPRGYGDDLERIDADMAAVVARLGPTDLLIVTADHGNDPTSASTDHSREYVPLLLAGPRVRGGVDVGTRGTFADVGATVAAALDGVPPRVGTSVLGEVLVR
ncbi:MAG TPA: phosphopentomutase [bacterium]|nr:phosphopentomutase [bacterium]